METKFESRIGKINSSELNTAGGMRSGDVHPRFGRRRGSGGRRAWCQRSRPSRRRASFVDDGPRLVHVIDNARPALWPGRGSGQRRLLRRGKLAA